MSVLLNILKKFTDEVLYKNDINTSLYFILIIKSFFVKVRFRMISLPRNIFNYWEVLVINLCNDFLEAIVANLYKKSLLENEEEYGNIIKYINREYFLDSLNCGDSNSLLTSYRDFVTYEKKTYISSLSNIGYLFFDTFEVFLFMDDAKLNIFDKIAITIGMISLIIQVLLKFNQSDRLIDLKTLDEDISLAVLDFSSNIFTINETGSLDSEVNILSDKNTEFVNECIKNNYLLPTQVNSDITSMDKFQSYILSLIFSFTKYDYKVSELISNSISNDLQQLKYFISIIKNISVKRDIYNSKIVEVLKKELLPITSSTEIFKCRDLTISFKDVNIINNFSYNFSIGEWISIYGESGCGKTTLCNAILGRNKNYQGLLTFCDNEYDYFDISEHTSYVSPNGGIFNRTVRENCKYGVKHEVSDEKLKEYLDIFNMSEVDLDSQCELLSTGQKQRVKVIRLLIHDRPLFFLDEITSNIDKSTANIIINEIRKICKKKLVIFITHNRELIKETDRIIKFENEAIYTTN